MGEVNYRVDINLVGKSTFITAFIACTHTSYIHVQYIHIMT